MKRVLVVGATGTIGAAVAAALKGRYDVAAASHSKATHKVDISDPASLKAMLAAVGKVDAIVSCAGSAAYKPLAELTDEDFAYSLKNKLMGQVNLARYGLAHLNDGGTIVLTTGVLAQNPNRESSAISLVNNGIEGFARAAALQLPRGIRIHVVSPPWVTETLIAYKMDPSGGKPAAQVAQAYVAALEGKHAAVVIPA